MPRIPFVACVAVVVAFAPSVVAQSRTRPDLSGRWTLVPERSTPADASAFGQVLTIGQTAAAMTLDMQVVNVRFTSGPSGNMTQTETGGTRRAVFNVDGADHEFQEAYLPPSGVMVIRTFSGRTQVKDRTYRAAWTGTQLVIMTRDTQVLTDKNGTELPIRRVIRQALALDTDGSLIADSLIVADPLPDFFFFNATPAQTAPVPVRSVYRKAS